VLASSVAVNVVSYAPVKGTYHGLFYEADGVRTESTGGFTLAVGSRGFYSGELQTGVERHSVSGRFALDGRATNVISRNGTGDVTVEWMLEPDATPTNCLAGRVVDGAGSWIAELLGDRAPVYAISQVSPYKGKYTFVIPGTLDPSVTDEPAGDSCGTAIVDAGGALTFSLAPAVGSPITQQAQVSTNGIWPLYVPMQVGKGALVGWVHLMSEPPPADSLRSDRVFWARPAKTNASYYPDGFEVMTSLAGSRYKGTTPVLPFTKGRLVFSGGNLPAPLTNVVKLTATNTVINRGPLPLTMAITRANGCFDGAVTLPGTPTSILFQGVILQGRTNGCGFFRNAGQVGRVQFLPAE
jgi:hypothetical protein